MLETTEYTQLDINWERMREDIAAYAATHNVMADAVYRDGDLRCAIGVLLECASPVLQFWSSSILAPEFRDRYGSEVSPKWLWPVTVVNDANADPDEVLQWFDARIAGEPYEPSALFSSL